MSLDSIGSNPTKDSIGIGGTFRIFYSVKKAKQFTNNSKIILIKKLEHILRLILFV